MKKMYSILDLMLGLTPLCANGLGLFVKSFADNGGGGDGGGGDGDGGSGGDGGGDGSGGGDGGGNENPYEKMTIADFKENFVPEDLRENGVWDKYEDLGNLAKGITELQTLASKKGDIPTDWEDEQAVSAFWNKLGRPEKADEYDFQMPENFEFNDQNYLNKISEAAHAAGMPKSMLSKFMGPIMEYEAERAKETMDLSESARTAAQARMSKEWGDSTQDMLAEVDNILGHFNVNEQDAKAIKSDTGTMLLLGKVANLLGERGQAGATFGKTKAGLNAQLDELNEKITTKLGDNGRNMNDPALTSMLEKRDRLLNRLN